MSITKSSIEIQKNCLQQTYDSDKDVYKFSTKHKGQLNSKTLKDNLLKLINAAANQQSSGTESDTPTESSVNLVGKHTDHQFTEDEQLVTYSGKVVSTVLGFPEWFNVVYDNEPDVIYSSYGKICMYARN